MIYEEEKRFMGYQHQYLLILKSRFTKENPRIARVTISKDRKSIPDGAIYDENTVMLIEAKTQSPIDPIQIEKHINNFIPEAIQIEFNWEDVYDLLKGIEASLNEKDRFLVEQFCEFLGIIGLRQLSRT